MNLIKKIKSTKFGQRIKKIILASGFFIPFLILFFIIIGYSGWQLTYIPKASCNMCHNISPYVQSYYGSDFEDNLHQEANVVCKDCHKAGLFDVIDEAVAYVIGDYQMPMRETKLSKENCLNCHRSYDSLIKQTAFFIPNPHNSPHFEEPECSECHKSHRESELLCSQCHKFDFASFASQRPIQEDFSIPLDTSVE